MTGVSTSIFASFFPSWPLLALLLLLALLFSFQQGGLAWKSIILRASGRGDTSPGQREAPRTHCWGTSRGWAVQTEPSLLLLQGLVAGEGWSQPGMVLVLEPVSGGSSETGTQDMGHGAGGWNVPARGSAGSPGWGQIPWGNQPGLCQGPAPQRSSGGGFGDARRGCGGAGWDFPGEHSKGEQCQGHEGVSAGKSVPRAESRV